MSFLLSKLGLKIVGVLAAIGAVAAVLLGARNAGVAQEKARTALKTLEIKREQEKAAARAARTRDDVVGKLRDGKF